MKDTGVENSSGKKERIQTRYRLDLTDVEFLLYECGLPLREQISLFGVRLSERAVPLSLEEFQVVIEWLRSQDRIDDDYAAWAETSFYRISLANRTVNNHR